jgi:hypothetical protein
MTYRSDREALEAQKSELEARLVELRARLAANKQAESEMLATVRALEETYVKLRSSSHQARDRPAQRALPILQRVYIASPCAVPWGSMSGDERERLCASCNKSVYDLSTMTTAEAEALLRQKGTDACLRIFRRFDGTILTADCPVGVEKKQRARRRAAVAAVVAATATATAGAALLRARTESTCDRGRITQGAPRVVTPVPNNDPRAVDGVQLPPGEMAVMPVPEPPPEPTRAHAPSTTPARSTHGPRRVR